jgi:hypothetical protein
VVHLLGFHSYYYIKIPIDSLGGDRGGGGGRGGSVPVKGKDYVHFVAF